jgi:putative transcriptional regulator
MSDLPPFAARLRQLRTEAKLTQQELAERAGSHRQTIAHLEMGTRSPSWDTVRALCRALGVSCTAFETDEPAGPPPAPRGRPRKDGGEVKASGQKKGRKRKGG